MSSQPAVDRSDAQSQQGDRDSARQDLLVELLDRYVADLERGDAQAIEDFAAAHSSDEVFRKELRDCLENVTLIHAAVESVRDRDARVSGQGRLTAAFSAPSDPHAADRSADATRVIGDYRLIREIGRGGMGVVYEAEEASLCRRVALKVLPFAAVLDQRQITRFRNEAQAAAGLHHPNIVPVFAIGQERGVHFYAMQHIEGQSLSQAIAELRREASAPTSPEATTETAFQNPALATSADEAEGVTAATLGATNRSKAFFRNAARLTADVADALQHAHELGVVHRDVKPSNLLIDGRGKVWVADFGLARMQSDLGVTATGDVVGTLRYMSPEQASGQADRVDGRTDVYALGSSLYELLTLRHALPGEDRRQVLIDLEHAEPIAPRKLNPAIPQDLENIVLRAMEKDRDRRYPSAGDLRDDLKRFLEGRPTVARPPSAGERLARWTRRRHKTVMVAAAVAAAVAAIATVSGVMIHAAKLQTDAALVEATRHRERAERLLDEARGVLDRFGSELSDQLAATPGAEVVRSRALEDTLAYYRVFLAESEGDAELALSQAQTRIRAAAVAERLGRGDEALSMYAAANAALAEILDRNPGSPEAAAWRARGLANHAMLLAGRGEADAALVELDRAVELRRRLVKGEREDPERLSELAATLSDRARLDLRHGTDAARDLREAVSLLSEARDRRPNDPVMTRRLAVALNAQAACLSQLDPPSAARANDAAVELLATLANAEPEVDAYRDDLAVAYSNRGATAAAEGRWLDSADAFRAAAIELARLAKRSPLVPRRRSERAVALASQGVAFGRAGRHDDSDAAFGAAERVLRGLVASYPSVSRYRASLAALLNNHGVVLRDSGRLDQAAIAFARAVRMEEERIASTESAAGESLLPIHYANHAQVLERLGRGREAARVETKRAALLDKLAAIDRKVNAKEATP